MRPYSAKEIREKLSNLHGEFRGGGFKVAWFETHQPHQRNQPPHFSIEFSRVHGFRGVEEDTRANETELKQDREPDIYVVDVVG